MWEILVSSDIDYDFNGWNTQLITDYISHPVFFKERLFIELTLVLELLNSDIISILAFRMQHNMHLNLY